MSIWTASKPLSSDGKVSACNAGDLGLIPRSGRSPGEGSGNPLQYSCLQNPMDGGAWGTAVHGVAKSQTRLSDFTHSLTHSPICKETPLSPVSSGTSRRKLPSERWQRFWWLVQDKFQWREVNAQLLKGLSKCTCFDLLCRHLTVFVFGELNLLPTTT